jgi:spore coat polysaccharide biosynthesis protein SpsF
MGVSQRLSNKSFRTVAFVIARLTSSRLSEKQFRKIGNKPLIKWITDNLRQSKELDEIVITTVASRENIPLQQFAEKNDLSCFWYEGDVDNVTNRLSEAAKKFNADICVLISGDCPLVYAPAIDFLVRKLKENPKYDYVSVKSNYVNQMSALEGVFVASKESWQYADKISDSPELKEHFFPIIFMRPDLFRGKSCFLPKELYFHKHRFSIDTWADLEFMNRVHDELLIENNSCFNLPNVLALLRKKPQLLKINDHVHQRTVVEDLKNVLIVVDAGGSFGYGHFTRSLELALQITERLSWPVTFLVDDEKAVKLLIKHGLRFIWGAIGRQASPSTNHKPSLSVQDIISQYPLIIFDIYWNRSLDAGWRDQFPSSTSIAILNRKDSWALEADKIIVPEVFLPEMQTDKIVGGLQYIIIRREIRNVKHLADKKNIDILSYLHRLDHQKLISSYAKSNKLSLITIDKFRDDFPTLLAGSRFFVSGFGYSFYESLFLGTIPLTLPLTKLHKETAEFFYEQVGMQPLLIDPKKQVNECWPETDFSEASCIIDDGTKHIIEILASMVKK